MPKKAYGKGGNKAYRRMTSKKGYGKKRGRRIYYATLNKYGPRGKSYAAKARAVFGKGKKRGRKKK